MKDTKIRSWKIRSWKMCQNCFKKYNYESENRDLCLFSYNVKTKSSGKKWSLPFDYAPTEWCCKRWEQQKSKHLSILRFRKGRDWNRWPAQYCYTVKSQSNRWDLLAFDSILNTIHVNSKKLYYIKKSLETKKTELVWFSVRTS